MWTLEVVISWNGHSKFFLFESEAAARAAAVELKSRMTNWGDARFLMRRAEMGVDLLALPAVAL